MSPERDERDSEEPNASALEEETRKLMEKAMESEVSAIESGSEEEDREVVRATSTARLLEETFQRIKVRMEDLLSMIEDSISTAEPNVEEQVSSAIKSLATKLKAFGLGVFYTQTVALVRQELSKALSTDAILQPVRSTVAEARDQVDDIVTKASRGAVKSVARSTGSLQTKVIQLYATLQDRERQIEIARAALYRWRTRVSELEAALKSKDETISRLTSELEALKQTISDLESELEERGNAISELKSQLAQAQSQIDQQRTMIEKLGSAEEMVADYESKLMRISELEGEVARLKEEIVQCDSTIEYLRNEASQASEYAMELEKKAAELNDRLAHAEGELRSLQAENQDLRAQVSEMSARWNMLYQVAEEEPAFKAYFLIADKTRGVPIAHIASALGMPVRRLKQEIERFVEVGLIEIDGDLMKPRALSEVARELAGQEAQMIEEVKAELGDDHGVVLEALDLDEPLFDEETTSEDTEKDTS
ncbi:MAG: hypothetical protein ACTSYX_10055 [Candidatus Thorarchaeota archaeon]